MSELNTIERGLERALEGYARLISEQSAQTNKKIENLTDVVQTLVNTSIKSEERHIQYDNRFERQGKELENIREKVDHISDSFISLSKDSESNIARWSAVTKIASGVAIIIVGAFMMSFMDFTK